MAKKLKKRNKNKRLYFALLIGLAVVSFWRGAWGLMDLYLIPDNPTLSFSISLIVGLLILSVTHYLIKELLGE